MVERFGNLARRWIGWLMGGVLILSLATWYFATDRLPQTIRVATASEGGLYHKFGEILKPYLEKETGRSVELIATKGSPENYQLLKDGAVELAVLQAGSVPMEEASTLAPLYIEPVHIIVRAESSLHSIRDLKGRHVALGPQGSGMRESARLVLEHYRVPLEDLQESEHYFAELETKPTIEAAVVTTGLENPDLRALLGTGRYRLLPILDAEALGLHNPFFTVTYIPRGLYSEEPDAVPHKRLPTVGTTALLAARSDCSKLLVAETLDALYTNPIQWKIPTMVRAQEVKNWHMLPLHAAALKYHDPYGGIGLLANFMESIAAIKELLFALGAGLYLVWDQYRRLKEKERQAEVTKQKEHLDELLNETVRIEREQMASDDPAQLKRYLDDVTLIKLKALEELTHEDLRGDQLFSIFLTQCANLIRKIQSKMVVQAAGGHYHAADSTTRLPIRKPASDAAQADAAADAG